MEKYILVSRCYMFGDQQGKDEVREFEAKDNAAAQRNVAEEREQRSRTAVWGSSLPRKLIRIAEEVPLP